MSHKYPSRKVTSLCLTIFLGAFYYFTAPMLWLDINNAREAGIIWLDEELHLRNIERMQHERTWELLHPAYTAFYTHISYFISWLFSSSGKNKNPLSSNSSI